MRIEDVLGLDQIVEQCKPDLARVWTGNTEHVAMIIQKGAARNATSLDAKIGFVSRGNAIAQLRQLSAVPGPFSAETFRGMATLLERGAPEHKVQCVVVGWGQSTVVDLDPDDLRPLGPVLN